MVVKVYISGISGNKEVKKRQQRVLLILDSKSIKYDVIDIAEPGSEEEKDFMQTKSTSLGATISDPSPRHPLPPQLFNDDAYCGDYDQFDMANEIDEMEVFLKLAPDNSAPTVTSNAEVKLGNGDVDKEQDNKPDEQIQDVVGDSEDARAVEPNNETDDQKMENGGNQGFNYEEEDDKKAGDDDTEDKADDA